MKMTWLGGVSGKPAGGKGKSGKAPGPEKKVRKKAAGAGNGKDVAAGKGGKGPMTVYVTGMLLFIGLMAGTYYMVARQAAHDKEYVALVGEQRLLAQTISQHAAAAASGDEPAFQALDRARKRYAGNLGLLDEGNPVTGMPGTPESVMNESLVLTTKWNAASKDIALILDNSQLVIALNADARRFSSASQALIASSEELVAELIKNGAGAEQVYKASRQLMLIERGDKNINRIVQGGDDAADAARAFGDDAAVFDSVVQGLRRDAAGSVRLRNLLVGLESDFQAQMPMVERVMTNSVKIVQVRDAAKRIDSTVVALQDGAGKLSSAFIAAARTRLVSTTLANIFGGLALLCMFMLGRHMLAATHARAAEAQHSEEQARDSNRRNQEAVLRLLDEIGDLADGDLTVSATVTEDFTGAIADSINFAIDAMREIVSNINKTTVQVASAAQTSRRTALNLSEASKQQVDQITHTSLAANNMAKSFEDMSSDADESAKVAKRSVIFAGKGAQAVQDTIDGMDAIREHIQETSKRIKRLGESSQEIGDIVGLIDDIADQTNILALNAAIQASMAGDAGRGFAVVADEVQRLAERSSNATKQIESLVKAIQGDTNEAINSMEKSTHDVVAGAKLAQSAGELLAEIQGVSGELSEMIHGMSDSAKQQVAAARQISSTMSQVQGITTQTTNDAQQTAASIGDLFELANELRTSVAGFRLPRGAITIAEEKKGLDKVVPVEGGKRASA